MENKPQLRSSILASLLFHALVLLVFFRFSFTVGPQPQLPLVKLIPVKKIELPPERPGPERISPVSSAQPEKPARELQVSEKSSSASPEKIVKPHKATVSTDLLKFDGQEINALIAKVSPKAVPREPLVPSLSENDTTPSVPPAQRENAEVVEEFLEKMPGFTPEKATGLVDSTASTVAQEGNVSGIGRTSDFQDLKDMLSYQLSTFQDPRDQQRYFKLSLRVNEKTQNLAAIPKEIIFLVDASISIQQERLSQFKKGILDCLNHLNPGDFFNVGIFKEDTMMFSPQSVAVTPQNTSSVKGYLEWIRAGERTDAFGALRKMIGTQSKTPSYIIFISDGWPTQGVTDSRQLINEISAVNAGKTAIFAYSGGLVNRYLLDFVAYKNRGWSEYSEREQFIGKNLATMYNKIKDPVLLNLRYRVSGVADEDVFPKMLPDFFRSAEFTLYGTYGSESELGLQLLGEAEGKTREFLAQVPLSSAVAGNKDIARNWAFNKIYYLISELQYGKDNKPILKEIESLSQKFDIKTPYSSELNK